MRKDQLLVVDDEEDIIELVRYNLSNEGYEVVTATTGEEALRKAREVNPAAILLDLMLPGVSGLDVCRSLKAEKATRHVPIIMLSAKGEESDIVAGLELGADDYITKPFSPRVLLARVRTVLRRAQHEREEEEQRNALTLHGVLIDPRRFEVRVKGETVDLTSTEFKLLHFLMRNRGFVFTRSQIIDAVHGDDYPVTDRSVDVQIVGLRRKLGTGGEMIETIRGIGYRARE